MQAGPVLAAIRPRLAALHHLTVNDASRVAIVSDVRAGYPQGAAQTQGSGLTLIPKPSVQRLVDGALLWAGAIAMYSIRCLPWEFEAFEAFGGL